MKVRQICLASALAVEGKGTGEEGILNLSKRGAFFLHFLWNIKFFAPL